MVVGVGRVVLLLPGNSSLKGKRKVVRSVLDRVRARFNVAAAEVADMDNWRRATLGLSVVSNDSSHANSMLDKILDFINTAADAVVADRYVELVHIEEGLTLSSDWTEDDD